MVARNRVSAFMEIINLRNKQHAIKTNKSTKRTSVVLLQKIPIYFYQQPSLFNITILFIIHANILTHVHHIAIIRYESIY
jgi:hypothetical protein